MDLGGATRFLDEATEVIDTAEGIADDEVPAIEPNDIQVRYQAPARSAAVGQPCELGVAEAALAIERGELSPLELLESCLATIERTEPRVRAFVRLVDGAARAQAALADQGPPTGVLHGIPFAAQDLLDTANAATEYGSAAFAGRMPRWDATVIARMRAAGGILVGKTATEEIGYGVCAPEVRNPWEPTRMAGGAAAALAARQVPMALGTDACGSLRLPSAFCGTTALLPTFGLVPRSGAMVLAPSFDAVGPMARSARDCLLLLRVMTKQAPRPLSAVVDLRQVRIGIADIAPPEQLAVAQTLRELGAQVIEVPLPSLEIAHATASVLVAAEAAAQFREHVTLGKPFAADIQAFLEAGLTVPVADFLHAQRVRAAIRRDYAELFGQVDVLLSPTSPVNDLPRGDRAPDGRPLIFSLLTLYTLPASLAGLPAITFPCGLTTSGLPIGAQLTGPARTEPLLAAIAEAYQRETDWHTRRPPAPAT